MRLKIYGTANRKIDILVEGTIEGELDVKVESKVDRVCNREPDGALEVSTA